MDPEENRKAQHEQSLQRAREREEAERRLAEGEEAWKDTPGVQSVVDAVRDLHFPRTRDEIREMAGDREVLTSEDVAMPLARVLEKLKGEDEFASVRDFQSAVQRHWAGVEFEESPRESRPEHGGVQPGDVDD